MSGWRAQGKNFKILEVQYDEIINSRVETINKIFHHVIIPLEKNLINSVDVHKSTSPPPWLMDIREALIDKDKNLSSY